MSISTESAIGEPRPNSSLIFLCSLMQYCLCETYELLSPAHSNVLNCLIRVIWLRFGDKQSRRTTLNSNCGEGKEKPREKNPCYIADNKENDSMENDYHTRPGGEKH